MRLRPLVVSLLLIAAACGGTSAVESNAASAPQGQPTTESPGATEPSTATVAPPSNGNTVTTDGPRNDGTPAPDFTTILADGSSFSLAEHDKPVYLVFWAEW